MGKYSIDFEKAFSKMDSDHVSRVGVEGNKLYIERHWRRRIFKGWYFREAYDQMYSFEFKNKKDAKKMFEGLTSKKSRDIYDALIKKKGAIFRRE